VITLSGGNVLAAKEINSHLFLKRRKKGLWKERKKTLFLLGLGKIWLID